MGPPRAATLPCAAALACGGDSRIAVDPVSGRNGYGCAAVPDPEIVRFGSSTASTVGATGYRAAEALCERLDLRGDGSMRLDAAAIAAAHIREDLIDLAGVRHSGGVQAILAASGTDAHLIFAQLALHLPGPAWLVIMPDAAESGSGVPSAMAGRHFASETALGSTVTKGAALSRRAPVAVRHYAVRNPDGSARDLTAVDDEIDAAITTSVAAGLRVLLVAIDGSKTGIVAPSPARLVGWKRDRGDAVEILVDACQFRLPAARLDQYLAGGCAVAVTGSKFMGGPIFSGALLMPGSVAGRLRTVTPPVGLADYTARHDWPAEWRAAESLDTPANAGLLLRWEAALAELRRYRAVPENAVRTIIEAFQVRLGEMMRHAETIEPVQGTLHGVDGTIFAFYPLMPESGATRRASVDEARLIYRRMREPGATPTRPDLRIELGQPVTMGNGHAALRLSLSAPLIADAHLDRGTCLADLAAAAVARVSCLAASIG